MNSYSAGDPPAKSRYEEHFLAILSAVVSSDTVGDAQGLNISIAWLGGDAMSRLGRAASIYKRVASSVLLMVLITMIIIKGHGFRVGEIYRRSLKFIETAVRGRKLHR